MQSLKSVSYQFECSRSNARKAPKTCRFCLHAVDLMAGCIYILSESDLQVILECDLSWLLCRNTWVNSRSEGAFSARFSVLPLAVSEKSQCNYLEAMLPLSCAGNSMCCISSMRHANASHSKVCLWSRMLSVIR